METLKTPQFDGWKVSPLKEKMESPAWPVEIYRFRISKGVKSKILRMDDQGNIIQSKFTKDINFFNYKF